MTPCRLPRSRRQATSLPLPPPLPATRAASTPAHPAATSQPLLLLRALLLEPLHLLFALALLLLLSQLVLHATCEDVKSGTRTGLGGPRVTCVRRCADALMGPVWVDSARLRVWTSRCAGVGFGPGPACRSPLAEARRPRSTSAPERPTSQASHFGLPPPLRALLRTRLCCQAT